MSVIGGVNRPRYAQCEFFAFDPQGLRAANRSALSSCRRKLQQGECRASIWSIGIAERLCHLQMMVVRCFDDLPRFARRFDRSREVTTLPLKVGGLQGPICNRDRRV